MYIINYKELNCSLNSCLAISKIGKTTDIKLYNEIEKYEQLIPDRNFEGEIESEDKIREYIRYYYVNVLSKLDPYKVYIDSQWRNLVVFDDGKFSHGHILSAWFELFLNVKVPFVKETGVYVKLKDTKPRWTVDILEDEIKKTVDNMKGFNSIRALYLFEQGEQLERKADELEERILNDKSLTKEQIYKLSDTENSYRQFACFGRCDADMAEDAWKERRKRLIQNAKRRKKKTLI